MTYLLSSVLSLITDVINKNCEGLALKFSECKKKKNVYRKMLEFIAEFTSFHFHTDHFLKIKKEYILLGTMKVKEI